MTGTAAIKIKGKTLHSAVGIPIEFGDNSKITMTKTSKQKIDEWREHTFLIVDEISMMDSKVMIQLNKQLGHLKNMPQKSFGGVNVLFAGDFLQLPSVSHFDLYLDKAKWRHGHDLWRSLNAVVILREQACQADDPEFAALLRRLRIHMPTDEDIDMLISRIGAPIPDDPMIPIIVRRHHVRHAINMQRLKHFSEKAKVPIIHCKAEIIAKMGMSMRQVYRVKQDTKTLGDAILSLIPGAPLIISQNINQALAIMNGTIVRFYGFSNVETMPTGGIIPLPDYILVKVPSDQVNFQIMELPQNVAPISPISFRHNAGHGKYVKLRQFPVSLAYAITDYKCQAQPYDYLRADIKKPNFGPVTAMSPYVQLSRARSLQQISIMRPFDPAELSVPLSKELIAELEWEEQMAEKTDKLYST